MADATKTTVKELEVHGYKFTVDTDLMDDVDTLEIIERIENKGQVAAVLPLLKLILGAEQFGKMKEFYTKQDADANKEVEGYKPRMRIEVLSDIYMAIIENFDPKG